MNAEGWYLDPYERHEQRWFSDGRPTALVRDGTVEGHDEPPADAPTAPLTRPAEHDVPGDLARADAATSVDQSFASGDAIRAATDGSGAMGIGFS